jgi:hypothetical protein
MGKSLARGSHKMVVLRRVNWLVECGIPQQGESEIKGKKWFSESRHQKWHFEYGI